MLVSYSTAWSLQQNKYYHQKTAVRPACRRATHCCETGVQHTVQHTAVRPACNTVLSDRRATHCCETGVQHIVGRWTQLAFAWMVSGMSWQSMNSVDGNWPCNDWWATVVSFNFANWWLMKATQYWLDLFTSHSTCHQLSHCWLGGMYNGSTKLF